MAKDIKNISVDEIFDQLDQYEKLRQSAIEKLLEQRKEIDAKLAKLGYTDIANKPVKKRHRRTKAEIEAAKAAEA